MTRELVHREMRGPGDLEGAMRRIEARWGIPFSVLYSLRYRPPSDIMTAAFLKIADVYESAKAANLRAFEHEKRLTEEIAGARSRLYRAGAVLAGQETCEEET